MASIRQRPIFIAAPSSRCHSRPSSSIGQGFEAGVDAAFESGALAAVAKRVTSVAEREVRSLLIGVRSVVDDVAGEIIFPSGDDVEQQFALDVDERGEMVAGDRDSASRHVVDLGGDLIGGQLIGTDGFFRQRFVLVLGEERGFVLKLQVHRVLDRR